ncbi:MAG: MBL fold metallo-hydrolase [Firmicutes bacterium]|nr:MBL fold metallo-hydrolase [Bacillota bacterium]
MIYEIDRNIYRIEVPLAGSPLGTLNAYYFRGPEEEFLMDTGFNTAACEASLKKSLASLGVRRDRLNIINTHLHVDHTGLDHWFVGDKKHIYLSEKDCEGMLRHYKRAGYTRGDRDKREGADQALFDAMLKAGPEADNARRLVFDDDKYVGLQDGDVIDTGAGKLKMLLVPGHTPGNAMYYMEDKKIMFTGDHVLFDITPNITFWPTETNALQEYLNSLEYSKSFDVALALPGHRKPGDYYARIDRIMLHHQHRLDEIIGIVGNTPGLTAYEIARRMRWKIHLDKDGNFPPAQMWFAAGECMSHLDKLVEDGLVLRVEGQPYITYRLP